jgi:hypothetical protein
MSLESMAIRVFLMILYIESILSGNLFHLANDYCRHLTEQFLSKKPKVFPL